MTSKGDIWIPVEECTIRNQEVTTNACGGVLVVPVLQNNNKNKVKQHFVNSQYYLSNTVMM